MKEARRWSDDHRATALLSGLLAAASSFVGKLGLDSTVARPLLARLPLLGLTLALNSAMVTLYTRSLALAGVAAEASLLNTAANLLLTALLSYFIFHEPFSVQWLVGAALILVGVTILLSDEKPSEEVEVKKTS